MRFFPTVFKYLGGPTNLPTIDDFLNTFRLINLDSNDFTTENYPPGSAGESRLFNDLQELFDEAIN